MDPENVKENIMLNQTDASGNKYSDAAELEEDVRNQDVQEGTYYYLKTLSCYYMQNKQHLLEYADHTITLVPKILPSLFEEYETRTIVPLVYLDWISRSPIALEMYCTKVQVISSPKFSRDNSDVDSELHLPKYEQIHKLNARLDYIRECMYIMKDLVASCECNYLHRWLLIRAECARVSIIMGSTAIFSGNELASGGQHKQDFEEAMELYEAAIQSTQTHVFTQYEALGLELFALFWLTAPSRPKEQVASGYLVEAIFVCEKWGAKAKADQIRAMYASVLTVGGKDELLDNKLEQQRKPDINTAFQASQMISHEVDVSQLIKKTLKVIVETSGAQRATLFTTNEYDNNQLLYFDKPQNLKVEADNSTLGMIEHNEDDIYVVHENGKPFEDWVGGPHSVVNFTRCTMQPTLLISAVKDYQFGGDLFISKNQVKSVLCMPIMFKNSLKGVLYLQNNLYEGLFTKHHVDLLLVLTNQMVIILENTRFFNAQMKEQIEKVRLERLTPDEERKRLIFDPEERNKSEFSNFMDMICYEIHSPLNGIFGCVALIFRYLDSIETFLQVYEEEEDLFSKHGFELRRFLNNIRTSAGSVETFAEQLKYVADDVFRISKRRD